MPDVKELYKDGSQSEDNSSIQSNEQNKISEAGLNKISHKPSSAGKIEQNFEQIITAKEDVASQSDDNEVKDSESDPTNLESERYNQSDKDNTQSFRIATSVLNQARQNDYSRRNKQQNFQIKQNKASDNDLPVYIGTL